jgi:hypothetical protein
MCTVPVSPQPEEHRALWIGILLLSQARMLLVCLASMALQSGAAAPQKIFSLGEACPEFELRFAAMFAVHPWGQEGLAADRSGKIRPILNPMRAQEKQGVLRCCTLEPEAIWVLLSRAHANVGVACGSQATRSLQKP